MKLKKITLVSKDNCILYKVACYAYNMLNMRVKRIDVVNSNKAIIYYKSFSVKMKR